MGDSGSGNRFYGLTGLNFMTVPGVGKKGAGVLRNRPNIRWNKGLSKDVVSAPWHRLFKRGRKSDHCLTLEEKDNARNTSL